MFFRRAALGAVAILFVSSASVLTANAADPAPAKPAAPAAAAAAPETKPVIKKFNIWGTRCDENVKTKALSDCHAFVDVRAGEQKQRFMYVGIGYLPKKAELFAFVMTPLGTILPPGVGIDVDGKTKFGAPFSFCVPLGCQAEIKLTDEQLKALKSGKQFEVLFRLMGQGVVKVPVKLDGLSAAIASLPKPKA